MKILLSGGGTGGHITPILAVAHELKTLNPDCYIICVGERGGKFSELTQNNPDIDEVRTIFAGKFRRYHRESWVRRILDIKTNLKNLRDMLLVGLGLVQCWRLLGKLKPDLVFLKGSFVGVPVGLAAASRKIPIITHDSDALPGLANRLVGRWTRLHATALEPKYYPYPEDKVRQVGVLLEHNYQPVTNEIMRQYRQQLNIPLEAQVLLITGGSSGATRLNEAIVSIVDQLLTKHENLWIIHQVGKGKTEVYKGYINPHLQVLEFMRPMYVYMGSADLVVTRASGTTLAELGAQGKAAIVVPNPDLTGGHQLENAKLLKEQGVAVVIEENKLYDEQQGLLANIEDLLDDEPRRSQLGQKLQSQTIPDATKKLAKALLETIKT